MPETPKGKIRVGIGGWTYEPWRGTFFPKGLTQKRELEYAASKLTSIEVNGTYYGTLKPDTFAKWHDETPDDFVFALKGTRFITNRRVLAEAGESLEKFLTSGIVELKDKLGPLNWQFAPTKKFDPEDFEAFLKLLPKSIEGRKLQHALEVRNDSFKTPEFIALAKAYGAAVIISADADYTQIADPTAPFIYVRAMGTTETEPLGYSDAALDQWARHIDTWAAGNTPEGLETVTQPKAEKAGRDVFFYVISGFKERNPASAMALLDRLK
ncbi:MAG TPA: DUF72 domain-containing protein [Devosiaceae bacterium]|jgi:uncharacterized protein YecE (DUF72 family)